MAIDVTKISDFAEITKMIEDGYCYVINNTISAPINNGKRAIFHMDIKDESGEVVVISIPNTWIPIDLAGFCDPRILLRSQNFRKNVTNNNLVVVSRDEAKQIRQLPAAQDEIKKLESQLKGSGSTGGRTSINTSNTGPTDIKSSRSNSPTPQAPTPAPPPPVTETASQQSPYDREMFAIIHKFSNKEYTEREAVVAISKLGNLPTDDCLKQIASNIGSSSTKIFTFIGAMIGATVMPTINEVFNGGEAELADMHIS